MAKDKIFTLSQSSTYVLDGIIWLEVIYVLVEQLDYADKTTSLTMSTTKLDDLIIPIKGEEYWLSDYFKY